MFLQKITVVCFAASYALALICELSQLVRRRRALRWLALLACGAGLFAHSVFLVVHKLPLASQSGSLYMLAWVLAVFSFLGSLHHRRLARVELPFGAQPFHGDDVRPVELRQILNARRDRAILELPVAWPTEQLVAANAAKKHRAGAAIPFRADDLGSGEAKPRAQEFRKGLKDRFTPYFVPPSIYIQKDVIAHDHTACCLTFSLPSTITPSAPPNQPRD